MSRILLCAWVLYTAVGFNGITTRWEKVLAYESREACEQAAGTMRQRVFIPREALPKSVKDGTVWKNAMCEPAGVKP